MSCFKFYGSEDEERLDYLLGTVKGWNDTEYKLFSLGTLCKATKKGNKELIKNNAMSKNSTDDAPTLEDNSNGSEPTDVQLQSNDSELLFTPCKEIPNVLHQQTYRQWRADQSLSFNFRRMRKRHSLYIQALEQLPDFLLNFRYNPVSDTDTTNQTGNRQSDAGFLVLLQNFLEIFFMGFDVKLLEMKPIKECTWLVNTRHHEKTGERQLLSSDIYRHLSRHLPSDGYAILGVTWTDLYPSADLNFVLGEAYFQHRAGVFCFGRFEPKSYIDGRPPPPIDRVTGELIWRMIKLISHETCHLFGLRHCVYFHCAMNESSSLKEALSQPIFLCPVCLRKIHKCTRFDLVTRYRAMLSFFVNSQNDYPCEYFEMSITWLHKCLVFLQSDEAKTPCTDEITRM